ncbi:CAP domain-containing protein [Ruegeria sp.]|uniref:CAP domain-containing protein n=1 Tax=Ruegeria sp. TaxID=1879320 RepID=UPI0023211590|nr:CAP domain-containing protein [Ruegeria sp.]MDA7964636.1 CAP domain-containing protein [Ruegeria sp.]
MSTASTVELEMLALINQERAAHGLDPLQLETQLNESSEDHSTWMLDTDNFSHTGSGGSTATQRMEAAGFDFTGNWRSGENIAWQSERGDPGISDDVAQLHENLMASPGHRANILNPDFKYIGIGIETGDMQGFDAVMVTQNFATTDAMVMLDNGAPATDEDVSQPADPVVATPDPDVTDPANPVVEPPEQPAEDPVAEVETPEPETPVTETDDPETPTGEVVEDDTPAEDTPVAETEEPETPAETPDDEVVEDDTPVGETPEPETPVAETEDPETPTETPVDDVVVDDTPVDETPEPETPVAETPTETPDEDVTEVETPAPETPEPEMFDVQAFLAEIEMLLTDLRDRLNQFDWDRAYGNDPAADEFELVTDVDDSDAMTPTDEVDIVRDDYGDFTYFETTCMMDFG